jgi:hypothetical protein
MTSTPKKLFICSLRFGNPDWFELTIDSQDAWAKRHGIEWHLYGNDYPHHPHVKFCEFEMIQDFLKSDAETFLYVDADVYIHPNAPLPEFGPGFHAATDVPHQQWMPRWRSWCQSTFGEQPNIRFVYRNAGVWACDRESAKLFLQFFKPPFYSMVQDQHNWDWALSKAVDAGLKLHELDSIWNRNAADLKPAYFFHILGTQKYERFARFEKANLIPHRPEPFPELPVPKLKRAIIYPWKATAAKWQELRYSLRSIEKFFEDTECPIIIMGTEKPGWLLERPGRVQFYSSWSYADALARGVQMAEKVLWMNDDILLLKPTTWADVETQLHLGPVTKGFEKQIIDQGNVWQQGALRALAGLQHQGIKDIYNFSTHTPYVYEREKALEIFRKHGCWSKVVMETLMFGTFPGNVQPIGDRKATKLPFGNAQYLNYTDHLLTPELKSAIDALLPDFAEWELRIKFNK